MDTNTVISNSLWSAALLVAVQSFLFGFCFSSLNSCLVTGDNNDGGDCYNNVDSSCPAGTIYNDINLSVCTAIFVYLFVHLIIIK